MMSGENWWLELLVATVSSCLCLLLLYATRRYAFETCDCDDETFMVDKTPCSSCIDGAEDRTEWFGGILNKSNCKDRDDDGIKHLKFITKSLLQSIDSDRDHLTESTNMYDHERRQAYAKLDKIIADAKPKHDNLSCDGAGSEVQLLKQHLSAVEKDVSKLSESLTREVDRNNRLVKQLNDSKKELQQKVLAVDAKITSDTLIVNEQTNAIKKAETLLATERKQHKALVAILQKRIKYAEQLAESAKTGSINVN